MVDRIKGVIDTGGVPVASREAEDVLLHPSGGGVAGVPDEGWTEAVAAYVVPAARADTTGSAEAPTEHVRGRLAAFKAPRAVRLVGDLSRNASGETLKRGLRGSRAVARASGGAQGQLHGEAQEQGARRRGRPGREPAPPPEGGGQAGAAEDQRRQVQEADQL